MRRPHWFANDTSCAMVVESFENVLSNAFVAVHFVSGSIGSSDSFKMNSARSRSAARRFALVIGPKAVIIWRIGNASTDPFEIRNAANITAPVR